MDADELAEAVGWLRYLMSLLPSDECLPEVDRQTLTDIRAFVADYLKEHPEN